MTNMYETPEVEIVEANVEKGFANSNIPGANTSGSYDEEEPVL